MEELDVAAASRLIWTLLDIHPDRPETLDRLSFAKDAHEAFKSADDDARRLSEGDSAGSDARRLASGRRDASEVHVLLSEAIGTRSARDGLGSGSDADDLNRGPPRATRPSRHRAQRALGRHVSLPMSHAARSSVPGASGQASFAARSIASRVSSRPARYAGTPVAPARRRPPARIRALRARLRGDAGVSRRPSPTSCARSRRSGGAARSLRPVCTGGPDARGIAIEYSRSTLRSRRDQPDRQGVLEAVQHRGALDGGTHALWLGQSRAGSRCPSRHCSSNGPDHARSAGIPCVNSTPIRNALGSSRIRRRSAGPP